MSSADMLVSPRTLLAMGAAGRLPRVLASVHPRFGSPAVAIAVHAAFACTLAVVADFNTLTALASSALLLIYFLCCTATIVLQRRKVGEDIVSLRLPFGPVIPLAATALVAGMMTTLTRREVLAVLLVVALAGVTYLVSRQLNSKATTASTRQ